MVVVEARDVELLLVVRTDEVDVEVVAFDVDVLVVLTDEELCWYKYPAGLIAWDFDASMPNAIQAYKPSETVLPSRVYSMMGSTPSVPASWDMIMSAALVVSCCLLVE